MELTIALKELAAKDWVTTQSFIIPDLRRTFLGKDGHYSIESSIPSAETNF
jgi:hypothetical protein